jgi:hypothetical protein
MRHAAGRGWLKACLGSSWRNTTRARGAGGIGLFDSGTANEGPPVQQVFGTFKLGRARGPARGGASMIAPRHLFSC